MRSTIEHQDDCQTDATRDAETPVKKSFLEPKLTFIEPKLTNHGDVTRITQQGFFGTFTP